MYFGILICFIILYFSFVLFVLKFLNLWMKFIQTLLILLHHNSFSDRFLIFSLDFFCLVLFLYGSVGLRLDRERPEIWSCFVLRCDGPRWPNSGPHTAVYGADQTLVSFLFLNLPRGCTTISAGFLLLDSIWWKFLEPVEDETSFVTERSWKW